jgi:hypothetical protein
MECDWEPGDEVVFLEELENNQGTKGVACGSDGRGKGATKRREKPPKGSCALRDVAVDGVIDREGMPVGPGRWRRN